MLETPDRFANTTDLCVDCPAIRFPVERLAGHSHAVAVPATREELVVEHSRQAPDRRAAETLPAELTRWRHHPFPG